MKSFYTYAEFSKIAEDFIISSGIRNICLKVCEGRCCRFNSCPHSPHARGIDHKGCLRHTPNALCSVWVCIDIGDALSKKDSDTIREVFCYAYKRVLNKKPPVDYLGWYCADKPFFRLTDMKLNRIKFSRKVVDKLREIKITRSTLRRIRDWV